MAAVGALVLAAVLVPVLVLLSGGGPREPFAPRPFRPGIRTRPGVTTHPGITTRSRGFYGAAGPLRAGPPAQPPPDSEQLGVNITFLFSLRRYRAPQIATQLAALARTGATLVRTDAPWEATEPRAPVGGIHRYHWAVDDRIVAALASHHLRWLPMIGYSPGWARSLPGADHSPPTSRADYADYAAALAQRYGEGGSFWRAHPGLSAEPVDTYGIWNEPDTRFFWSPRPDLATYAELYLRARAAITSVQHQARVITGGLTRPAKSLPQMLRAQPRLRGHIDGIDVHPYGRDPQAVLAKVRAARTTLRSLGLVDVPLYMTEFGWTIRPAGAPNYASADQRPWFIFQTITSLRGTDCSLAAVLLYSWFAPELNPANAQDWFGINPPSSEPGPAVRAFARALGASGRGLTARHLCARRGAPP
jgi:hypothetical protein